MLRRLKMNNLNSLATVFYTVRHNYRTPSFKRLNLVNIWFIYMKISCTYASPCTFPFNSLQMYDAPFTHTWWTSTNNVMTLSIPIRDSYHSESHKKGKQFNLYWCVCLSCRCKQDTSRWCSDYCEIVLLLLFISDKEGGTCFCTCLSVCLLARLLKNAWMDLDEMLRVDRCRDMDELVNFWARSGS